MNTINYANNVKIADDLLSQPRLNPIILDIRTKEEFMQSHLCGSINVETPLPPLDMKESTRLAINLNRLLYTIPSTRPIIVYCKKGTRAAIAKNILRASGFTNVINIGGVLEEPLRRLFANQIEYRNLSVCI